jgi:hypothetical protein
MVLLLDAVVIAVLVLSSLEASLRGAMQLLLDAVVIVVLGSPRWRHRFDGQRHRLVVRWDATAGRSRARRVAGTLLAEAPAWLAVAHCCYYGAVVLVARRLLLAEASAWV